MVEQGASPHTAMGQNQGVIQKPENSPVFLDVCLFPADVMWEILRWLDTDEDWLWLVEFLSLTLHRATVASWLRKPLPILTPREALDHNPSYAIVRWKTPRFQTVSEQHYNSCYPPPPPPAPERVALLAARCGHPSAFTDPVTKPDKLIYEAARGGQIDLVRVLKAKGAGYPSTVMKLAACGGHGDIVQLAHEWGADSANGAIVEAASNGHLEVIRQFKKLGEKRFNEAIAEAAGNGHAEVLDQLLEWTSPGSINCDWPAVAAAQNGHLDLVRTLKQRYPIDVTRVLYYAALVNQLEASRMCLEWGADHHKGMVAAIEAGHEHMIELFENWKEVNLNWVMAHAAKDGKISVLEHCKDHGATKFDLALECAIQGDEISAVEWLLRQGAIPTQAMIRQARQLHNPDIARHLRTHLATRKK